MKADIFDDQDSLAKCIQKMQRTSDAFYCAAIKIQNHPFIEFAGLMNEYIKVCEGAIRQGKDFRMASRHTEQGPLDLADFQKAYIREKLECIYGEQLFEQKKREKP